MKLDPGCGRSGGRNIHRAQHEVRKVEGEDPDNAAGQVFPPTDDLMLVGEVALHLPDTLAVLVAKRGPIRVLDDFQYLFIHDLKPVTGQRRLQIVVVDRNVLVGTFRQLGLGCEGLAAIDSHGWKLFGGALRVNARERSGGQYQSNSERFHSKPPSGNCSIAIRLDCRRTEQGPTSADSAKTAFAAIEFQVKARSVGVMTCRCMP